MKCKKEEQQGGAGRGARRGKKTCEESLMGRTGQKKNLAQTGKTKSSTTN
jgi:hypothetical protein